MNRKKGNGDPAPGTCRGLSTQIAGGTVTSLSETGQMAQGTAFSAPMVGGCVGTLGKPTGQVDPWLESLLLGKIRAGQPWKQVARVGETRGSEREQHNFPPASLSSGQLSCKKDLLMMGT